jgi:PAS domain S-box-containing protein
MLTSLASLLVGVDAAGNVVRWNASAAECLGLAPEEVLGRRLWDCPAGWDQPVVRQAVNTCQAGHHTVRLDDVSYDRPDGTRGILELIVSPVRDEDEGGVVLLGRDISHQRLVESQLAQAQKLEAMGQLAAGIAHEINTPTQYVGDNTRFLQEALADLGQMLAKLGGAVCKVPESADPADTLKELADLWEQLDVGYLLEEMPKAVEQSLEGIQRVTQIVRAMKEFSHPQRDEMTPVDLNHAIESTVTICRNEWKYVAELDVQLDPALPPVTCLAGQVNQVILNLIINAAHAIEDRAGREDGRKGRIVVSTRPCDEQVEIRISDNGCGISPEAKDRIFDLFFTTKPTGRGTGQGLAIARATIEERHGGTIDVESVEGEGTTFTLRLPLSGRDDRSSDKPDPPKEHAHA